MDFTLNTLMGDRTYANLVMRSCLFVNRANSRRLSLGRSSEQEIGAHMGSDQGKVERDNVSQQQQGDEDEFCVVSFQKKAPTKRGSKVLGSGLLSFLDHRDSVVIYNEHQKDTIKRKLFEDDDDETASTVDMDEDEFHGSQSRRQRTVHFTKELVTAVYTRPRTTKEDKYYLHYDEYDYMDFKLEYRDDLLQEQRRKREQSGNGSAAGNPQRRAYRRSPRKVSFKRDVVDSVHPVMDRDQRSKILSDLFYTEEEMRSFLDEFVASLQKQSMQKQAVATS